MYVGMAETKAAVILTVLFFCSYSCNAPTSAQDPSPAPPPAGAPSSPVTHRSPQPSKLAPAPSSLFSSPPPTPDCTTVVIDNLSPCLTFVEKGSNVTVPDKGCCRGLAAVVSAQPVCLCQLLGGGSAAIPIDIDRARALTLPTVCRVQTPPVSLCAVMGAPVSPPVLAPSPSIYQGGSVPSAAAASPAGLPRPPNNSATPSSSSTLATAAATVGTMLHAIAVL